jgi:protocatechuate 3,4-dioxygenase beta subunit
MGPLRMDNQNITEEALARLENCDNPRLKTVMTSVISHLHSIVREVEPTMEEWDQAINFLTEVGHWCDDKRQEFILLSDTLAVSILVDALLHQKPAPASEGTLLGPFHVPGAPELEFGANISRDGTGEPTLVTGRVLSTDGLPIQNAKLDVWQASAEGYYDVQQPEKFPDMNLRGIFRTDAGGKFGFCTEKPASYPIPTDGPVGEMLRALGRHAWRPAHIHFIVSAEEHESLTTHLFVAGDPYLDSDVVQAVKEGLIVDFKESNDSTEANNFDLSTPYFKLHEEFVLAPTL